MSTLLHFRTPSPRQARAHVAPSRATMTRTECMPPSLVYFAPVSGGALGRCWHRLMFWLLAPAPQLQAPPSNRLGEVKREFGASLADLDGVGAEQLRWRVRQAHSLRELWHLRSDVYNTVALAHSQGEAEARLLLINQHFPTRAPRSQFAPL
ncbi:MAG: hypothetical protein O9343_16295 [Burkholderiaceae bacterium]|jgi:hypothetical protein|nr:hypothetical protein [Burkholderiaceae bacterium]